MTKPTRFYSAFVISVSGFLLLTAVAKVISLIQGKLFLDVPDGVFAFVKVRHVLTLAATLEVTTAIFILLKRKCLSAALIAAWLAVIFGCYRMLSAAFLSESTCPCLGRVLDFSGLSPRTIDAILLAFLYYMGVGSLIFLVVPDTSVKRAGDSPIEAASTL